MIEYRLRFGEPHSQVSEEIARKHNHHKITKDKDGRIILVERYAFQGVLERRVEYAYTNVIFAEEAIPVVIKKYYDANGTHTGESIWYLTHPPRCVRLDKEENKKKIIGTFGTINNEKL